MQQKKRVSFLEKKKRKDEEIICFFFLNGGKKKQLKKSRFVGFFPNKKQEGKEKRSGARALKASKKKNPSTHFFSLALSLSPRFPSLSPSSSKKTFPLLLQPDRLLPLGQVGHEQQRDDRVRRDAHAVGREAGVERQRPPLGDRLEGAVDGARVGHLAVRSGLHLLDLRLDVVEGQRGGRGEEAGDHRTCVLVWKKDKREREKERVSFYGK